jgi:DNA repair exonuclease SbcCD ATPase subunit
LQKLPVRSHSSCQLCGQAEDAIEPFEEQVAVAELDAKARLEELKDALEAHRDQERSLGYRIAELSALKSDVESRLSEALQSYDSLVMSNVLEREARRAALRARVEDLKKVAHVVRKSRAMRSEADQKLVREAEIKRELEAARAAAERDTKNLAELERLFLDCLVRCRLPGIDATDRVTIQSPGFLPNVTKSGQEDVAVTSFGTLGSGGKKTLFKCCFALAVHRLATKVGALLPRFMIIDTPMKNISERENRLQFEGFHELVYDLAAGELSDTQFILIDKEYCAPRKGRGLDVVVRHMTPDDDKNPPLIPYYRGH